MIFIYNLFYYDSSKSWQLLPHGSLSCLMILLLFCCNFYNCAGDLPMLKPSLSLKPSLKILSFSLSQHLTPKIIFTMLSIKITAKLPQLQFLLLNSDHYVLFCPCSFCCILVFNIFSTTLNPRMHCPYQLLDIPHVTDLPDDFLVYV